jgi:hypothetical protein
MANAPPRDQSRGAAFCVGRIPGIPDDETYTDILRPLLPTRILRGNFGVANAFAQRSARILMRVIVIVIARIIHLNKNSVLGVANNSLVHCTTRKNDHRAVGQVHT